MGKMTASLDSMWGTKQKTGKRSKKQGKQSACGQMTFNRKINQKLNLEGMMYGQGETNALCVLARENGRRTRKALHHPKVSRRRS